MSFSLKNNTLGVTLLLGGGAMAYAFAVFLPTQRSTALLQAEIDANQDYIHQAESTTGAFAAVEQQLRDARGFAHQWQASAPQAAHLAPMLGAITRCATEARVTGLQFDPRPAQPLAAISRVPLVLACDGAYEQIFQLLRKLEALPQTVWIDDLRIAVASDGNAAAASGAREDKQSVHCELTLVVFADNRKESD
jgi:Tfp pilus assembly protein PilO